MDSIIHSISHFFTSFFDGIYHWLQKNPTGTTGMARNIAGFVTLIVVVGWWIGARRRSRKRTHEHEQAAIEEVYEKNEDGLYPWEVNTNDHPDSIDSDVEADGELLSYMPERGRWKI